MNAQTLKDALSAIPAGQHGAVSVHGTPIEVPAFNWVIVNDYGQMTLKVKKDDGLIFIVETKAIDFFYTFPIPNPHKVKR